ncbi:MAG TPA: UbiA prenyltransferase family protein [Syntrophorhabdales bacterium]|nr:UbiA prenyltransferase family protein [Syntrophorhabdales bacterium]
MNFSLGTYICIARPRHWVKHVFIIPGIGAALLLVKNIEHGIVLRLVMGFASACLIASANYIINEWLDAKLDRHHPLKCRRPGAEGLLSPPIVLLEYVMLSILGLGLAFVVNELFFFASSAFILSGVFYNVKPFRTKDCPYLDVATEAINNPIRLLLGWAMVSGVTVPPLSLLGAYWLGGAFLMAAKRLSEYKFIIDSKGFEAPGQYRKSFQHYTDVSLLVSCFVYAIMASFLLSVFLLKYRTELILSFPLFTLLFAYYLHMAMQRESAAQRPEELHKDRGLVIILMLLIAALTVLSFIDMPWLETILQSRFTEIHLK